MLVRLAFAVRRVPRPSAGVTGRAFDVVAPSSCAVLSSSFGRWASTEAVSSGDGAEAAEGVAAAGKDAELRSSFVGVGVAELGDVPAEGLAGFHDERLGSRFLVREAQEKLQGLIDGFEGGSEASKLPVVVQGQRGCGKSTALNMVRWRTREGRTCVCVCVCGEAGCGLDWGRSGGGQRRRRLLTPHHSTANKRTPTPPTRTKETPSHTTLYATQQRILLPIYTLPGLPYTAPHTRIPL